ncbi:ABC transporter substrate-binding protein [Aureimonas sp. Leaf454]|uniref:Bug family tripartite tricarboxylate transporter substrate binding protein n=1 Tax=Aureimonas sp. Leaf454 TaxID=1736381 RepID=UPI0006FE74F3|nr:tripartite tricarboxylate transporter substrate binding protein [Aureimonas sp. Leaf454]KQT43063.1 ABC transporter substrate-binding protein [Aureimonas sp. Leaf454]
MKRRTLLAALAAATVLSGIAGPGSGEARAQDGYPQQPVRLVVPFAAGGSTDLVGRVIAQGMGERLGQQVVVENKGGAGGNLGATAVAQSAPDGYTILMGTIATHALSASLYAKPPFDPEKDFAPIVLLVTVPNVLTVNKDYPAKDVKELIARLKEKPGEEVWSSSGNGTPLHLSGQLFMTMTGTDMIHVPYQGSGPALVDALSGAVPINFDNLPSSSGHIKGGALRALAVTTKTRVPLFPDVPTMEEAGVPGYETNTWNALFAPAGTPPEVVAKLNAAANEALKDPAVVERLAGVGATVVGGTPEQLAAHVTSEIARWRPVIEAAGVRMD